MYVVGKEYTISSGLKGETTETLLSSSSEQLKASLIHHQEEIISEKNLESLSSDHPYFHIHALCSSQFILLGNKAEHVVYFN